MKVTVFLYFIAYLQLPCAEIQCQNIQGKQYSTANMQKGTYSEARGACQSLGSEWDLPDDTISEEEVKQVSTVWLIYQKEEFPEFTWLNNDPYSLKHKEAGGSCAGIAVALEDLQSIPCGEKGVGFMCQMPSNTPCPKYFSYLCLPFDDFHFVIGCGVSDWYDAQSLCTSFGGHLAILDSEAKRKRILDFIKSKKLFNKCGWSFAGLRKDEWKASLISGDIRPRKLLWKETKDTVNNTKMCLVYNIVEKLFVPTLCDSSQEILCQSYNKSKATNQHFYDHDRCREKTYIALFSISFVILLCFLILILFILLLSRRIRQQPISEEWKRKSVTELHKIASDNKKRLTTYLARQRRMNISRQQSLISSPSGIEMALGETSKEKMLMKSGSKSSLTPDDDDRLPEENSHTDEERENAEDRNTRGFIPITGHQTLQKK